MPTYSKSNLHEEECNIFSVDPRARHQKRILGYFVARARADPRTKIEV